MTFDGENYITYDEIGNPTRIYQDDGGFYYGYELTWEGRQLLSYTYFEEYNGSVYYDTPTAYTYNADGIRTSKTTYFGTKYEYLLDGSRIVSQTWGTNIFVFIYDENGSPIGINYTTVGEYALDYFQSYYFEKNLQGDIVAIYNSSGTKIGSYTYDAWGNVTTNYHTSNTTDSFVVTNNPFRYRGYYYDSDTQLYYLQTRYYDPANGRLLNADGYVSTGTGLLGYNMFAYCGNNPVNRTDPSGQLWIELLIVTVVVAVCTVPLSGCSAEPSSDNSAEPAPQPEPYKSADDAARAFSEQVYSSSSYIRHEYATEIYSRTINGETTYNFNPPQAGTPHSAVVGRPTPEGTTIVAYAHTHPNSNVFSNSDILAANNLKIDGYVVGPNLELQRYDLVSASIVNLGVISPIPLTAEQRSSLVAEFQGSWYDHTSTGCGFGCGGMVWPTP